MQWGMQCGTAFWPQRSLEKNSSLPDKASGIEQDAVLCAAVELRNCQEPGVGCFRCCVLSRPELL